MNTSTKFKPVLMSTDNERGQRLLESANAVIDRLNKGLIEVASLLDTELDEETTLEVMEKGFSHVLTLLRSKFQFPSATDEFNLQAMGKVEQLEKTKLALSSCVPNFKAYSFNALAGKIKLSEEGKAEIAESTKSYTENEAQNEAFELAKRLSKELNTALEKNLISKLEVFQISRKVSILGEREVNEGRGFAPHSATIKKIKSDGSMSVY